MGGIVDGLKWGIILNLGAVVILPVLTKFLGTHPGSGGGGRPFAGGLQPWDMPAYPPGGYANFPPGHHPSCDDPGSNCTGGYGYFCGMEDGYCGGVGDQGGYEGGGHKKKKKHGHGGGHGGGYW